MSARCRLICQLGLLSIIIISSPSLHKQISVLTSENLIYPSNYLMKLSLTQSFVNLYAYKKPEETDHPLSHSPPPPFSPEQVTPAAAL